MASAGQIKAGEAYVALGARLDQLRADLNKARGMVRSAGDKMQAAGRRMFMAGAAIAAPLAAATKEAADFESAMADLRKVTDEETMEKMQAPIREMARTMPLAHSQLADLATQAGRFGVEAPKNIKRFTKTVSRMTFAIDDLTASEAGKYMAKIGTQTQTPTEQIENMGSSVNALANNFATSGGEIVDSAFRSSAALNTLGASTPQIMGLSAAANVVSESAHRAGTRLRRVAQEMQDPKKVERIAKVYGMTAGEFRQVANEAPVKIMMKMASAISEGNEEGRKLKGIFGSATRNLLNALGTDVQMVTDILGESSTAFEEATSLKREYAIQVRTVNAQAQILWNRVRDIGVAIGKVLLPAVRRGVKVMQDMAEAVREFIEAHPGVVKAIAGIAGGLITLGAAVWVAGGALKALAYLMSPNVLVAGAVAGLVALAATVLDVAGIWENSLGEAISNIKVQGASLHYWLKAIWNRIAKYGTIAAQKLMMAWHYAIGALKEFWVDVKTVALNVADAIWDKWDSMTETLAERLAKIGEKLGVFEEGTAEMVSTVGRHERQTGPTAEERWKSAEQRKRELRRQTYAAAGEWQQWGNQMASGFDKSLKSLARRDINRGGEETEGEKTPAEKAGEMFEKIRSKVGDILGNAGGGVSGAMARAGQESEAIFAGRSAPGGRTPTVAALGLAVKGRSTQEQILEANQRTARETEKLRRTNEKQSGGHRA